MSDIINILETRGFLNDLTDRDGLHKWLSSSTPRLAYIGFDCTASSLHIGSLLQIMMLRWWQKSGHTPVVLLGGGTTRVGDPSGRDASRKILSEAEIASNQQGIKSIFSKFLSEDGTNAYKTVDNADWLMELNYLKFLREYGAHFSVNRMLTMDSVSQRLERDQHLSFLEFNYMVLQSYDFVELARRYDCRVQLGGSDQWGNIIGGVELGRRVGVGELYGITSPLITTSTGAKMGKTADGAVWLNADLISPYDYWQYWRNVHDDDVKRFLKLYTELPLAEIEDITKDGGQALNDAKKILATEATRLLHGQEEAIKAAKTAEATFAMGGVGEALPEYIIPENMLNEGAPVYIVLAESGLAASRGEARRLVQGGGIKIDDNVVNDPMHIINTDSFNNKDFLKLSAGKKKHIKLISKV